MVNKHMNSPNANKSHGNQKGFTAVEALLLVLILLVIGFGGYYVWNNQHKNNVVTTSATAPTKAPNPTTKQSSTTTASPYTGWKTYCDARTNGCFHYPADWKKVGTLPQQENVVFGQNPAATLNLEYTEPSTNSGNQSSFYVSSINSMYKGSSPYKTIGGYFNNGNVPGYYLVSVSLVDKYGLKTGTTTNIGSSAGLSFTAGNKTGTFIVHLNNTTGNATMQASRSNAWFDSINSQTALKIVRSFYIKQ